MENGTMIQFFHWYTPADGSFWKHTKENAKKLAELGINAAWLPPAFKCTGGENGTGYDVYDIYDLGEFDQKGGVRTKFGTKQDYIDAIKALHDNKVQVYADVVLNHMGGGDEKEKVTVKRVDPEDRNKFISGNFEIEAYTKFTFPGRKKEYSEFVWDKRCFTGVDYAADLNENAIFSIQNEYGEGWEEMIDTEKGNYDYLMFNDIDFRNTEVREELKRWGGWYMQQTGLDGVRLDAVKHMSPKFYNEWLDEMRKFKPNLFAVGEYWAPGYLELLLRYIDATEGRMSLFDSSLQHNLHNASTVGKDFDLSTILHDSLVAVKPELAVTVVDNHDTQPLQSLEAPVEHWFKKHAYALTLLRAQGYPCVFYPDLFGAHYTDKGRDGQDHEIFLEKCEELEQLLMLRKEYAFGTQRDYFDHPNCIGWTREGVEENNNSGCAVVLSNGDEGYKDMEIGKQFAGKAFREYLQKRQDEVVINEDGWGRFPVNAGDIAVWVAK